MAPLDADDRMRSVLVMVRKIVRRGAQTDMAHNYAMQDPEVRE